MCIRRMLGLTFCLFVWVGFSVAQDSALWLGVELRPRMITDRGYKTPQAINENTLVYATQRTRINAQLNIDNVGCYVSLQDVRMFGDDDNFSGSGTYGNTQSVSIHQAWTKINMSEKLAVKVGRQLFTYDDQRILSSRNWNDYQVTYDALRMEYHTTKSRVHLVLSYNAESKSDLNYSDQKFKLLDFVHYQYVTGDFSFSGIALLSGNTLSDSTSRLFVRGTYGLNGVYHSDVSTLRTSVYYQHNLSEYGGEVAAWCFSVFVQQKLSSRWKVGLGFDFLSGDENPDDSQTSTFDILYGRRHGWYGYMDYFSNTPQQGLQDFMMKVSFSPIRNLEAQLDGHYFTIDKKLYLNDQEYNKNLGQELDLTVKWHFHQRAVLQCGYSVYNTSSTLKRIKEQDGTSIKQPGFMYVMVTVKPTFRVSLQP